jgi:hypothetical protein
MRMDIAITVVKTHVTVSRVIVVAVPRANICVTGTLVIHDLLYFYVIYLTACGI